MPLANVTGHHFGAVAPAWVGQFPPSLQPRRADQLGAEPERETGSIEKRAEAQGTDAPARSRVLLGDYQTSGGP